MEVPVIHTVRFLQVPDVKMLYPSEALTATWRSCCAKNNFINVSAPKEVTEIWSFGTQSEPIVFLLHKQSMDPWKQRHPGGTWFNVWAMQSCSVPYTVPVLGPVEIWQLWLQCIKTHLDFHEERWASTVLLTTQMVALSSPLCFAYCCKYYLAQDLLGEDTESPK